MMEQFSAMKTFFPRKMKMMMVRGGGPIFESRQGIKATSTTSGEGTS